MAKIKRALTIFHCQVAANTQG